MSPNSSFRFELSRTARTREETILITDHIALRLGGGISGKLSIRGFQSMELTVLPVCRTSLSNGFPRILDGGGRGVILIASERRPVNWVAFGMTIHENLEGGLMLSTIDVLSIKIEEGKVLLQKKRILRYRVIKAQEDIYT